MIFKTPITVSVPGEMIGRDSRGNPIYADPVVTTYYGEFRPLQGDEVYQRSQTTFTRFRVYLPAEATGIPHTATVTVMGHEYELVGEPEPHNIGGRLHHHEIVVQRRTG